MFWNKQQTQVNDLQKNVTLPLAPAPLLPCSPAPLLPCRLWVSGASPSKQQIAVCRREGGVGFTTHLVLLPVLSLYKGCKSIFLPINPSSSLNGSLVFHWKKIPLLGHVGISNIFLLRQWNREYFCLNIRQHFFPLQKKSLRKEGESYIQVLIKALPLPDAFWFLYFKQGSTIYRRHNSLKWP